MKNFIAFITALLLFGGNAMASETLSIQQQAIVKAAAFAAIGNQNKLKSALAEGLDADITLNDFKEILVQAYAYCGFPRSINALTTLMQLETERGNSDIQGKLPASKPEGTALEYGAKNQTKLVGAEVKGRLFEFAPAIDEYLKAHLFGDIFSRDNIDWQTRELATIAMLAAREGVDDQLQAHINIGKHNGLTDAQVSQILEIVSAAKAQDVIFGFGKENPYGQYFIGKSYLQPITTENGVPMFNVSFEPRCRNNWHIHHNGGQILLVTQGRGWYQEWGKPARALKVGDVVNIPPETKHWHGAAKDSWFTHIAVEVPSKDGSNEWLEPVTDDVYDKLEWK
ncbi:MAG: carboxymuconolactone decarboxylase family protein [Alphaproteobacteria bacterium]|nr:carboxymuconolactone decarboxylase family protein [Alphaproteobacteria bacterium]